MEADKKVKVCMGSSCFARGNSQNLATIESFLSDKQLKNSVELVGSCCEANCLEGPVIEVGQQRFTQVSPQKLNSILLDELMGARG